MNWLLLIVLIISAVSIIIIIIFITLTTTFTIIIRLNYIKLIESSKIEPIVVYKTFKIVYLISLGNPAGGGFRGKLGRFIFENTGLYQNILLDNEENNEGSRRENEGINSYSESSSSGSSNNNVVSNKISENNIRSKNGFYNKNNNKVVDSVPKNNVLPINNSVKNIPQEISPKEHSLKNAKVIAVNYITGLLFRKIPLSIILRGEITQINEEERTEVKKVYNTVLSSGTVRADFDSPLISVGKYSVRVGPKSNVVLDTPYLDKKIRTGLGARGSSFIFKKTENKNANNWKIDLSRKPLKAKNLGFLFLGIGGMIFNLFNIFKLNFLNMKLLQILRVVRNIMTVPFILFGFLLLFSSGGIRDDSILEIKK